jgi:hypothetical protein
MQTRFMKHGVLAMFAALAMFSMGTVHAAGVPNQGTWESALQPRDID